MNELEGFELGWVVGLLEGEGCFGMAMNRLAGRDGGRVHAVNIQISSTDLDTLETFLRLVGFGSITGPYERRSDKHRELYYWRSWAREPCAELMRTVLPFMGERRRQRIIEILGATNHPLMVSSRRCRASTMKSKLGCLRVSTRST